MTGTERDHQPETPANTAPDAVKAPDETTDGKPGLGPQGGRGEKADPGGS